MVTNKILFKTRQQQNETSRRNYIWL